VDEKREGLGTCKVAKKGIRLLCSVGFRNGKKKGQTTGVIQVGKQGGGERRSAGAVRHHLREKAKKVWLLGRKLRRNYRKVSEEKKENHEQRGFGSEGRKKWAKGPGRRGGQHRKGAMVLRTYPDGWSEKSAGA